MTNHTNLTHAAASGDPSDHAGSNYLSYSQRLKLHALGSVVMLIVGTAWIIVAVKALQGDVIPNVIIAGWLTTLGFTWHVVTRIRISRYIQRLRIAPKARFWVDTYLP